MNVSAQIRALLLAGLPAGSNTGYILATRAFPAATRAIVASTERNSGSVWARCSTSKFQAPVRMISACGAAALSRPTIEARREAKPGEAARRVRPDADKIALARRREQLEHVVAPQRQRDRADLAAVSPQEGERSLELRPFVGIVQPPYVSAPGTSSVDERLGRLARAGVVDDP